MVMCKFCADSDDDRSLRGMVLRFVDENDRYSHRYFVGELLKDIRESIMKMPDDYGLLRAIETVIGNNRQHQVDSFIIEDMLDDLTGIIKCYIEADGIRQLEAVEFLDAEEIASAYAGEIYLK